jgi:hypothetical protein
MLRDDEIQSMARFYQRPAERGSQAPSADDRDSKALTSLSQKRRPSSSVLFFDR